MTTNIKIETELLIEAIKSNMPINQYLNYRAIAANLGIVDKKDRSELLG